MDDLGSPNTYNHYPTGWAAAFSTPFKMFKRYSYAAKSLAEDDPEAHDLAGAIPDKLREMVDVWFEEADKFDVLPLDDRVPPEILADPRPQPEPDRDTYIYFPHILGIPPEQVFSGSEPLPQGRHVVGVSFDKESVGQCGEAHGTARLYVDDEVDIGHFVGEKVQGIPGIADTRTVLTFRAF